MGELDELNKITESIIGAASVKILLSSFSFNILSLRLGVLCGENISFFFSSKILSLCSP